MRLSLAFSLASLSFAPLAACGGDDSSTPDAPEDESGFTTPTVQLLQTQWYRRGDRAGAPMVMILHFNQRVRPDDVVAHLTARFERHDWEPPALPAATSARLRQIDPQAPEAFAAKVAVTRAVAESTSPVTIRCRTPHPVWQPRGSAST